MKKMIGILGTALLLVSAGVSAAPINGDVTFFGAWQPKAAQGLEDATTANATHIEFVGDVLVSQAIGDFNGATGAEYTDFTFDPFVGPIAPLWTVMVDGTMFEFALERVNVGLQTTNQLALSGSGTLTAEGFDAIEFAWSFTGDSTGAIMSFSASAHDVEPTRVPETSTLALLGIALLGAGFIRKVSK